MILAGGLATRMLPQTVDTPKWLLPVCGRPFAHWQLEWLSRNGVDSVVCCVGHLGDHISRALGDGGAFGLDIAYSCDGPSLMGTGGALALAADRGLLDERVLVVYGDSFLSVDIAPIWSAFASDDRPALMTVFRNEGRFDRSNASYADGTVLRYTKRREAGAELEYIDYGLSVLEPTVLEELSRREPVDLADVFEALADRRLLAGYEVHERFYEIGSPGGLLDLERRLSITETDA